MNVVTPASLAASMLPPWASTISRAIASPSPAHEQWHFRYVGVDAATDIWQRGITLEEYLA